MAATCYDAVFFIASSKEEFTSWEQAISSYVIQLKCISDTYKFLEKCGEGSYGVVYLATEIKGEEIILHKQLALSD
jgi:hypothetical protein